MVEIEFGIGADYAFEIGDCGWIILELDFAAAAQIKRARRIGARRNGAIECFFGVCKSFWS